VDRALLALVHSPVRAMPTTSARPPNAPARTRLRTCVACCYQKVTTGDAWPALDISSATDAPVGTAEQEARAPKIADSEVIQRR